MDQLADQDDKGASSRRSRKDIEGRDFICGCGKKYLSYPALYTHIKTKHDGRQPEGTQKTGSTVVTKRKSKIQDEFLIQIQNILKKQDVKILQVIDNSFQGSTPLHSRIKKDLLPKQVYEAYQNLTKQNNWIKLSKDSSYDAVMAVYLIGIGQHVVQKLHQQYCLFAKLLRQCYYSLGEQIYQKCFSKKEGGLGYIATFNAQRIKYLPIICDFFCRFFLPFDYKDVNKDLMGLLISDFCDWLNKMKLTFINVSMNKEYKLQKPLQIVAKAPKRQKPSSNQRQNESHCSNDNKQFNEMMEDIQNQKRDNFKQNHEDIQNKQDIKRNQDLDRQQRSGAQRQGTKENGQIPDYQIEEWFQQDQNEKVETPEKQVKKEKQSNNQREGNWSLQPEPASESIQEQIRQVQQEIKEHQIQQFQKAHHHHGNHQAEAQSQKEEPRQNANLE